jgi:hypothetical protein
MDRYTHGYVYQCKSEYTRRYMLKHVHEHMQGHRRGKANMRLRLDDGNNKNETIGKHTLG